MKLLRLLQYYPPSGKYSFSFHDSILSPLLEDPTIQSVLNEVLRTIMNNSAEQSRNVQHNNAQNAILFEAISLAIHLDTSSPLVATAAVILARFISSKETNVRYLALDTMAHMAARADSLEPMKKHQGTIILCLRDKDISVRRRALDLLYSMCDVDNAEPIVDELLQYLKVADYGLREEMVLKIAILTEKYATSYKWYIDTILQLIFSAGDHVGDEVWYRVVQITTNTEGLQEYAVKVVFEYLRQPSCHESLIKVGGSFSIFYFHAGCADSFRFAGYILGEYGHLIANEPGYSPQDQFRVLHGKSQFCAAPTRTLLLSTYMKWVNVFPEIKPQLVAIFDRYRYVLDSELQQRACEFYALASRPDDDELVQNICEEMPPFPPRESALLGRINRKLTDTGDKRTWIHGGKEANIERGLSRPARKLTLSAIGGPASPATGGAERRATIDTSILDSSSSSIDGLPSLMESPTEIKPPIPLVTTNPSVDRWFERLCYTDEGVLYEDVQLQLGIKSEWHGHFGRVAVYMGNKIATPLTSVTAVVHVPDPEALSVTFGKMPANSIPPRTQIQQLLQVECKKMFTSPPIISISFLAGSLQTVTLRLPIIVTKFIESVQLGQSDFFERWKAIGGPPREAQSVFPIDLDDAGHINITKNKKIVAGQRFSILESIDPNPSNLVGAGVLHMSSAGKVGCLLRLEPNREAKVSPGG